MSVGRCRLNLSFVSKQPVTLDLLLNYHESQFLRVQNGECECDICPTFSTEFLRGSVQKVLNKSFLHGCSYSHICPYTPSRCTVKIYSILLINLNCCTNIKYYIMCQAVIQDFATDKTILPFISVWSIGRFIENNHYFYSL